MSAGGFCHAVRMTTHAAPAPAPHPGRRRLTEVTAAPRPAVARVAAPAGQQVEVAAFNSSI